MFILLSGILVHAMKTVSIFFLLQGEDRVSVCILGCLGICSRDQTRLEPRDMPVSASSVLGSMVCLHVNLNKKPGIQSNELLWEAELQTQ